MNEGPNLQAERSPLFKEALKSVSYISAWFDYRAFSKQRHELLNNPTLAFTGPDKSDYTWKSPLRFAIQGFVITSFLIQLAVSSFGLILARPKPYTERIRTAVQQSLNKLKESNQTLKLNLATVEGADESASFEWVFDIQTKPVRAKFGGVPRAEYTKALKAAIAQTENALKQAQTQSDQIAISLDLASRAEQLPSLLYKLLLPFTLVLAAYVFRFLFKTAKETRGVERRNQSDVAFLYLTTSHLFWMNVALALAQTILHLTFIYSGLYDREMFASPSSLGLTQVLFMEAEISVPAVLCLPLIIVSFRKISAAIRTVFNLPPSTLAWIASYVRVSHFISFLLLSIVLVLFSWEYARVALAWEGHKIRLDKLEVSR